MLNLPSSKAGLFFIGHQDNIATTPEYWLNDPLEWFQIY